MKNENKMVKNFAKEGKGFNPNDLHQSIYEYIYYNDRCKKTDLNIALTHQYHKKTGKYIRRKMNFRQLNRSLNDLLKFHHIEALGTRAFGEKKDLPDIFTANLDFIHLFPNIKKKIRFGPAEIIPEYYKLTADELKEKYSPSLLKNYYYTEKESKDLLKKDQEYRDMDGVFQLYETLLAKFTIDEIKQDPNSKPFYFSDEQRFIKSWLIRSFIHICFAYNPDLWKSIEKPEDLNFEISFKVNIPKQYQDEIFESFKKVRDFCIDKRSIPYIPEYPLKKAIAHIWRMKNGQIKKSRETIQFHNDIDIFDAVAYKQHTSYEENKVKNKIKEENNFKEFIKILKQSTPHYLGSQELISINKQMNKIKK